MLLSPAVVLWNSKGQSFLLRSGEWDAALALARARGWQQKGTRRPPVSFNDEPEPSWDGQYARPMGQEVTAADAREFAQKLMAPATESEVMAKLSRFASAGGFLICSPAPQPDCSLAVPLNALATALARAMRSGTYTYFAD